MNFLYRALRRKKGFTLVEIIIVLVILAILAAIMIPSLTGYIDKANEKAMFSEARGIWMAAQTTLSEAYALRGADLNYRLVDSNGKKDNVFDITLSDGTKYSGVGRIGMTSFYPVQHGKAPADFGQELALEVLKYLESDKYEGAAYPIGDNKRADVGQKASDYFKKNPHNSMYIAIYYGADGKIKYVQFAKGDIVVNMKNDGTMYSEKDGVLFGGETK